MEIFQSANAKQLLDDQKERVTLARFFRIWVRKEPLKLINLFAKNVDMAILREFATMIEEKNLDIERSLSEEIYPLIVMHL